MRFSVYSEILGNLSCSRHCQRIKPQLSLRAQVCISSIPLDIVGNHNKRTKHGEKTTTLAAIDVTCYHVRSRQENLLRSQIKTVTQRQQRSLHVHQHDCDVA